MSVRLGMLRNRHSGERCVIVANGPSLNRMELGFLRDEHVFGLNKIHLGFKTFGFYPRYYAAVNAKVIEQSASEIRKLNCVKFLSNHGAEGKIPENGLTYHINTTAPPQRFCHDISKGVHEGWTVTYAALQIAYFLGFVEVILIGLDHRFQYDGQPNEAKTLEGPDPNHFCSTYFGYGQKWDNPDLPRSEESYKIARSEYEKAGRKIIDATLDGACTVFEKKSYHDIFSF